MSRQFDKMTDAGPVDTKGQLIKTCIEYVVQPGAFSGRECGRKLKGDPEFPYLCGLHTSVIHRRRAKSAKHREKVQEQKAKREAFAERVAKVAEPLGLTVANQYYENEHVSLDIAELEKLAELIEEYVPSEARGGETPWFRQFG